MPFTISDILPGDSGSETFRLANNGTESFDVQVSAIEVTESENGLTEPESKVDSTAGGELGALARGRLYFEPTESSRTYVVGGPDQGVPIEEFPADRSDAAMTLPANESVTLGFDWMLPPDTANVIQTDSVSLTVTVSATTA
jgi:hypothetical protein